MTQGNVSPIQAAPNPIDPGVRIGHVHLRTADIDRVRDFYVSVRWGLRPNVRQIRPIVDFDRLGRLAIDACVQLVGADSNVATSTCSTCSAVSVAARPGRRQPV
jgi:hypothetical protein